MVKSSKRWSRTVNDYRLLNDSLIGARCLSPCWLSVAQAGSPEVIQARKACFLPKVFWKSGDWCINESNTGISPWRLRFVSRVRLKGVTDFLFLQQFNPIHLQAPLKPTNWHSVSHCLICAKNVVVLWRLAKQPARTGVQEFTGIGKEIVRYITPCKTRGDKFLYWLNKWNAMCLLTSFRGAGRWIV